MPDLKAKLKIPQFVPFTAILPSPPNLILICNLYLVNPNLISNPNWTLTATLIMSRCPVTLSCSLCRSSNAENHLSALQSPANETKKIQWICLFFLEANCCMLSNNLGGEGFAAISKDIPIWEYPTYNTPNLNSSKNINPRQSLSTHFHLVSMPKNDRKQLHSFWNWKGPKKKQSPSTKKKRFYSG